MTGGEEGWRVAVLGATGLVGDALVKLLDERKFPVRELIPLASARSLGKDVSFRGERHPVLDAGEFDYARADIALLAVGPEVAREHAPRAAAAGCLVVDHSVQFRDDESVPLVVPEVNPEALEALGKRGIVACPGSIALQVLLALKPLHDAAGLERVGVTACLSASAGGQAGVDALAEQSVALMSGRGVKAPRGGGPQLAFNAIAQADEFLDDGSTQEEARLVRELRRVLGDPAIQVSATAVRMPVFFGHGAVVAIETRRKLGAAEARSLLQAARGVEVMDTRRPGGSPTPVQAANHDTVYVGRIREDMSHDRGLLLWVVADNVRKGAANGVQIAEILARDHL